MSPDEKTCPHCAETVKAAAVKCKHCGSDLPPLPPTPADDVPEKKQASCGQMLGCFGVLMVVGLISAIFNAGDSDTNNIADAEAPGAIAAIEKTEPLLEPPVETEHAESVATQEPEIQSEAVAVPPAGLRELCYVGVNSYLPAGVTVGEFLDRGTQRGYFRNTLITGDTVRFRSPQNSGALRVITLSFRRTSPTPECNASFSATLSSGSINFERLNDANLYVLLAMLEAMAFSDDVEPLTD
jgi:hypothetical protein